jgi:site-specific DNA recombinase
VRTVIYARFSSQLQNSRSVEDQIRVCRERADREGWEVVDVFADHAISGAAGIDEAARPQLNACLERIEAGDIEQLLTESTDRLARHQADSHTIRERVNYAGARVFTLLDGEVDDITGTIKGLMDARFRKDLGERIKRGQRGAVANGRSPAGLPYGYRKANRLDAKGELVRGLREIHEDQALVVQRIFSEYASGLSARAIAERLNNEGVPGPTGGKWRLTTIAGDRQRQNGILQNRLYAGVLVHNRTRKVTDPKSRKQRIRPNPESEWISMPVPELRIIDDELWEAVQSKRNQHSGSRPECQRRPKHLLSGLAVCGICGGGWTVVGNGYWACGRYRDGRGCTNNRSIRTDTFEHRVLAGLKSEMLHPDVVDAYVREYRDHYRRVARDIRSTKSRLEREMHEADKHIQRFINAIAEGIDVAEIKQALESARNKRAAAEAELANLAALPTVALHPAVADDYRQQVASLENALAGDEESRLEVIPKLRALVERIVVTPAGEGKRGVELAIEGRLAAILALASGEPMPDAPRPTDITVTVERVKGIEPSS